MNWPCLHRGCSDRFDDSTDLIVHMIEHVNERLDIMTQAITDLQAADQAEGASVATLTEAVNTLATEQASFLADIAARLGATGNGNDVINAIVADINARKSVVDGVAAQVAALTSAQQSADADLPAAPAPSEPVPPVTTDDGSADAGETVSTPAADAPSV